LQSGTVGASPQGLNTVALVPETGNYPVDEILVGERIKSVRALIQKPSPVTRDIDLNSDLTLVMYHGPYQFYLDESYFNYYGKMFLAFAGGVRYKFITYGVGDRSMCDMAPAIGPEVSMTNSLPLAEYTGNFIDGAIAVDVTVPYYHNEKYVPAYKLPNLRDHFRWNLDREEDPPQPYQCSLYYAASSDSRLTFFRAQGIFLLQFVDPGEVGPIRALTFPALGARKALAKPLANIDQYRARTGRNEFKISNRTSVRRAMSENKTNPPPFLTEEQAIRESE